MAEEEGHHEIVIIHRGGHGDHDEHHGGVWKIAFADFMTAMMAFFLVMWLVSANDKTKAAVVKFFNPVHLVDATSAPPGLQDKSDASVKETKDVGRGEVSKAEPSKTAAEKAAPAAASGKESAAQKEKRLDNAMRENPIAALTEIAAAKGQGNGAGGNTAPSAPVIGRRGGEAFRDPFAPPAPPTVGVRSADDEAAEALAKLVLEPDSAPPVPAAPPAATPAAKETADKTEKTDKSDKPEKSDKADKAVAPPKSDTPVAAQAEARRDAETKSLLAAVQDGGKGEPGPKVDVRRTPEGLVLSLTDTADFSMFSNGSAVPAREVVMMMDRVAGVLKSKTGSVIIRGFTDNKPYRGTHYDNWHLSLDRAQVAHYMLVHGGLDDSRIGHVEGYADRSVKTGVDASSPLNRRIEILLKDAG